MGIGNEHWSGPEELIQKSAEIRAVVSDNQAVKILEAALKALIDLNKPKIKEGKNKQEHWSGPDDLLGR